MSCTSLAVGKNASADGSTFLVRCDDWSALQIQRVTIHPAHDNPQGAVFRTADFGGINHFECPLPPHALRWNSISNWKTGIHASAGFNEAGVGMTATETIYAREDFLPVDPYNDETGIKENDIPDVVLPYIRTAREGCARLGHIVETIGAGEGFGVGFMDDNEVWWFETGTGHQWIARRVPDDYYFATANQGRLTDFDPASADWMGSPTVISFAQEHGYYDPKKDGAFNFAKAYDRNDERDRIYNDPRVWSMQKRLNPALEQDPHEGRSYPVFLEPEKKITLADIRATLRDHYVGTGHDPYVEPLNGKEAWRPITIFRTAETHILQVRPWLPREIGNLMYVASGMAELSIFLPFYSGLDSVPQSFTVGGGEADDESIYWKLRKVQTLTMTDYTKLAPIVKETFGKFEEDMERRKLEMEEEFVGMKAHDEQKARTMLNHFNRTLLLEAEALATKLLNRLFTIRTQDIEELLRFNNRNKRD